MANNLEQINKDFFAPFGCILGSLPGALERRPEEARLGVQRREDVVALLGFEVEEGVLVEKGGEFGRSRVAQARLGVEIADNVGAAAGGRGARRAFWRALR